MTNTTSIEGQMTHKESPTEFTTQLHTTAYAIPFADFLYYTLSRMRISPTSLLTLHYTPAISYLTILSTTRTDDIPNHTTVNTTSLSLYLPYDLHINIYPICIHLTRNEAIKYLNTFITLCYTTDPKNRDLIAKLVEIKTTILNCDAIGAP